MLDDDLSAGYSSPQNRLKEELARRMQYLLDLWQFEKKQQVTYPQVVAYLSEVGNLSLSRVRWSYLLSGNGHLVTDTAVLTAIAQFFSVDPNYLLDLNSEPPADLQARLSFVQDLRELRVQRFAARNLSDVSPETLQLITSAIRTSREQRKRRAENPEA